MPTDALEAVVFGASDEPWLSARTLRALERLGIDATTSARRSRTPTWFVRAGAIPVDVPRRPPPSATGQTTAFVGATKGDAAWSRHLRATGGVFTTPADVRFDSVLLHEGAGFDGTLPPGMRAVRWPAIDVALDSRLAVIEVVTTLHRGGAERVVLDLVRELRTSGHDVVLAVMDRSNRATFDEPENTVHLSDLAANRRVRVDLLADMAIANGADIVHVHLLEGSEMRHLARTGIPLVVTVHNARPGWPPNLKEGLDSASLVIACACDVADELFTTQAPVRTIWNGILPERPLARAAPSSKKTLLTIANHRPQKRLDRVPAIVAGLGNARAIVVGEPVKNDPTIASEVLKEALRLEVEVAFVGSKPDSREALASADVVLTTSDFEGLSLVQLEAMAAGVPLVTTRVSGTREIAAKHEGVTIVDAPETARFVEAIRNVSSKPAGLAPDFTAWKSAERHAELFRRALRPSPSDAGRGVVIVTNNFSVGGAQSSARRLLLAFAERGIPVRAAVLEEQRDHPTPGRAALARAGVEVHVAPRGSDPIVAARDVCAFVDRVNPEAVLFWNVIAEHKVLMADMLFGRAVWDVSPGEMYFHSFDRYFRKPRVGSPYLASRDYGRLLAGAVVKFEAEKEAMDRALGVRVHVIPNGVDVPARPVRRPRGSSVVIGTLARISPDKKLEELVDAARKLEVGEIHIAGPAETEAYAESLRERAKGLPVRFVGMADASAFLSEIDIFAMVSEPSGCPNASLEAMAAGLPVVATDHGGAREQIVHGETGLVVPRGDASALGAALVELAYDAKRSAALGDAGHARAREKFSISRMADAYARTCLGAGSALPEQALRS